MACERVLVSEQVFEVCVRLCEHADAIGGGGWDKVFIDDEDLVYKEVRQGVAQFLGGGDVVLDGCRVGEFLHDGKELLAAVCAGLYAVRHGVLLCFFQEMVIQV